MAVLLGSAAACSPAGDAAGTKVQTGDGWVTILYPRRKVTPPSLVRSAKVPLLWIAILVL